MNRLLDATELSKTCMMYTQGQSGYPPPILIPTRLFSVFVNVQLPDVRVSPLKAPRNISIGQQQTEPSDARTEYLRMARRPTSFKTLPCDQYLRLPRSILITKYT